MEYGSVVSLYLSRHTSQQASAARVNIASVRSKAVERAQRPKQHQRISKAAPLRKATGHQAWGWSHARLTSPGLFVSYHDRACSAHLAGSALQDSTIAHLDYEVQPGFWKLEFVLPTESSVGVESALR
jgi:hypothetical protein